MPDSPFPKKMIVVLSLYGHGRTSFIKHIIGSQKTEEQESKLEISSSVSHSSPCIVETSFKVGESQFLFVDTPAIANVNAADKKNNLMSNRLELENYLEKTAKAQDTISACVIVMRKGDRMEDDFHGLFRLAKEIAKGSKAPLLVAVNHIGLEEHPFLWIDENKETFERLLSPNGYLAVCSISDEELKKGARLRELLEKSKELSRQRALTWLKTLGVAHKFEMNDRIRKLLKNPFGSSAISESPSPTATSALIAGSVFSPGVEAEKDVSKRVIGVKTGLS